MSFCGMKHFIGVSRKPNREFGSTPVRRLSESQGFESCDRFFEIRGQGSFDPQAVIEMAGMELQATGVEHGAFRTDGGSRTDRELAIAHEGQADVGEMQADLIVAPGSGTRSHQRARPHWTHHLVGRPGRLAPWVDPSGRPQISDRSVEFAAIIAQSTREGGRDRSFRSPDAEKARSSHPAPLCPWRRGPHREVSKSRRCTGKTTRPSPRRRSLSGVPLSPGRRARSASEPGLLTKSSRAVLVEDVKCSRA